MKDYILEEKIRKAVYLRGNWYYLRIQVNHKRTHRPLDIPKQAGRAAAEQRALDMFRGSPAQLLNGGSRRLSTLYDMYRQAFPDRNRDYLLDVKRSIDYLIEEFGDMPVADITTSHVTRFRAALLKRTRTLHNGTKVSISGHRINGIMRVLRAVFHQAEREQIISKHSNPFDDFPKTKVMKKMPRSFGPKDFAAYRKKAVEIFGEDYALMLDLYLLSGMRDEEWTKVKWEWVDWEKEILILPPEFTKTGWERIIPLVSKAAEALTTLKQREYESPVPFSSSEVSHRWRKLRNGCTRGGVEYKGTGIQGKFHNLRKTVITRLKIFGLHPDFIDILVGHVPNGTSATHYTDYEAALPVVRTALEQLSTEFFSSATDTDEAH